MTVDSKRYLRVKTDVATWIDRRPGEDPVKFISELSLATSCPVIVICQFIGELHGFTPELNRIMATIMKFYHIDEIT